ncbi:MAG: molybdenum cofactor biosynthesis protein MoeA [Verrucomicrobiaceae bacterium]|nr:molybdenum cofactor biosynthesis protein MoeA [Verrucomicrobiaceae bacterium]
MPKEVFGRDHAFLPKSEILSFEELARLARIFVDLGVEKIRLTGGEPLLRRDLPRLVEMLANIDGLKDLTLTTNGSALAALAKPLRDAGLQRLTVSVDSLDSEVFRAMNDVDFPLERVLEGIAAAIDAGFGPIKINMVAKRGVNEHQIVPMAKHFSGADYILRYIEYMDVGNTNHWRHDDVIPASEIIALISREIPLIPLPPNYAGEVANRFRHVDGGGEIGVIASVTQPFCKGCTRARIAADGQFYTCLFASSGHDLRALLRGGLSDEGLAKTISALWHVREDRYSELRSDATLSLPKAEMSRLGG